MSDRPTRYLFIFAHPDDETVGCGGTIARLAAAGDEVFLASVTDGAGGEVMPAAQAQLAAHGGKIGQLRWAELRAAAAALGVEVDHVRCLGFSDGQITNQDVWGKLTLAITDLIDELKPEVVVTFDHSGWYFHLDHVATSIATTMALFQAKFPPQVAFHAHYWIPGTKWRYAWPPSIPVTHQVDISAQLETKKKAITCHCSQSLGDPQRQLDTPAGEHELYQLIWQTENGNDWCAAHPLFEPHHASQIERAGRTAILSPTKKSI